MYTKNYNYYAAQYAVQIQNNNPGDKNVTTKLLVLSAQKM
jgi:hypothetical protein